MFWLIVLSYVLVGLCPMFILMTLTSPEGCESFWESTLNPDARARRKLELLAAQRSYEIAKLRIQLEELKEKAPKD